jgi:cell division transport system permease protein
MRKVSLRPAHFDDLGLRRALSDRLMPALVAAMAFLAALALAGAVAASSLAGRWREGAAAAMTEQVPHPNDQAADGGVTRLDRVVALLRESPGIVSAAPVPPAQLQELLRPWLGSQDGVLSLPLPAVIQVRLADPPPALDVLTLRLRQAVPDTIVEGHGVWMQRLTVLARSLQACAALAVLLVAGVAAAVIAVAIRAGLAARRDAIEIVHGLGATDGYIAGRFAGRATRLASIGAAAGAIAALPVLLLLAGIAAPFAAPAPAAGMPGLPVTLWLALPGLPVAAAAIGWATAQGTVRTWLRRLA